MRRADAVEERLPEHTRVRFVGDLHLGDGASNDPFGDKDRALVDFLSASESACDAVVFMGDAFDLPQAWTVGRIVRAHPEAVRSIEQLAERIPVFFIRGNHDWTVDYEGIFPGARACETLCVGGARVMHGHQVDRYCNPDQRFHHTKVVAHHLAERAFGFHFRVPLHEHDTWQNRMAHWLGGHYGFHLRRMADVYRRLGLPERANDCEAFIHYWSRSVWGDPNALFQPATDLLEEGGDRALVCGHTHLPGVVDVDGRTYVNAGSWAFGAAQYAQWDGTAFEVHDHLTAEVIGDDRYGWMLSGEDPGSFFAWWEEHYLGGLRFKSR